MPSRKKFDQQTLSLDEQIQLLISRGLNVSEPEKAKHFLATIGYSRLIAYSKPFLIQPLDSDKGFLPNTEFSDVLQLYIFDRSLRLLVSDALERIEVALRAAISQTLSSKFGPHWYLDSTLFLNQDRHHFFQQEAEQHFKRSKEDFIKHYYATYDEPRHPPSWMAMECLSFGTLSQLYHNIKDRSCRKAIGDIFQQYSEMIKSWMRALTFTRNICAHHARLWNRFFINTPQNSEIHLSFDRNRSPFIIQAHIIDKLLQSIAPDNHWKSRLFMLFEEYDNQVPFQEMGFQQDWRNDPFWKL
jgi:abortive infection bacteriophage resistance protein